jgi:hypothetical protein
VSNVSASAVGTMTVAGGRLVPADVGRLELHPANNRIMASAPPTIALKELNRLKP